MEKFKSLALRFAKEESGQGLSEYALILGIVVIAAVAVLIAVRDKIIAIFQSISNALTI
ncbi:MAG: Flp family type IVb pilin [Acetatifactor sp.]|nr:Flp family type IVb pilin [Acetatifactor sp.]